VGHGMLVVSWQLLPGRPSGAPTAALEFNPHQNRDSPPTCGLWCPFMITCEAVAEVKTEAGEASCCT